MGSGALSSTPSGLGRNGRRRLAGRGWRRAQRRVWKGQREALGCLSTGSHLTPATKADKVTSSSLCIHKHDWCSSPFTNSFCGCPKCDFTTSPIGEPCEPRPTSSLPPAAAPVGQRSRAAPGQKGLPWRWFSGAGSLWSQNLGVPSIFPIWELCAPGQVASPL